MSGPTTPGIVGYRSLTDIDKHDMNAVKAMENQVGGLIANLVASNPDIDKRLVSMAISELQVGFMLLVRSIAQPQSLLAPLGR